MHSAERGWKESNTIVIPVQFNSDKRCFDITKYWYWFRKSVFGKLKKIEYSKNTNENKDSLKWKKVVYSQNTNKKDTITDVEAFEEDVAKIESEETYFYEEAYRTIYDSENKSSCFFMLYSQEEKSVLLEKKKIKLCFDKCSRQVRKVYLYLTNAYIGLLIIETVPESVEDLKQIDSVTESKLEIEYEGTTKDVLTWALGEGWKDKDYWLPFKQKCFLASYQYPNIESSKESDSENIEDGTDKLQIDAFMLKEIGLKKDRDNFFSHQFQIFWLCILQKVEILHISHMSSRISRKRFLWMTKDIKKVNREYAIFYNQYDLVECTCNEKGEKLYEDIRKKLHIDKDSSYVREQMSTLLEYTSNKILDFISVVSFVAALCEVISFFRGQ